MTLKFQSHVSNSGSNTKPSGHVRVSAVLYTHSKYLLHSKGCGLKIPSSSPVSSHIALITSVVFSNNVGNAEVLLGQNKIPAISRNKSSLGIFTVNHKMWLGGKIMQDL